MAGSSGLWRCHALNRSLLLVYQKAALALMALLLITDVCHCEELVGDVVAVRTFGDQVVTEHNMVPPDGNLPSQQPQTLTADLDMFSLECASCEDAIPAIFEYADSSARMYTVLSDHALSVFIMPVLLTGGQVTLTQVLPLDDRCVPLYLKPLSFAFSSSVPVTVICQNMSVQFATVSEKLEVSLSNFGDECRGGEGIVVEGTDHFGGKQLYAVSYIEDNCIDVCGITSDGPVSLGLPSNVNCLGEAKLYSIRDREAFILRCRTAEGYVLYEMPLFFKDEEDVQAIDAKGYPYSSFNGKHLAVIDGGSLVVYSEDKSMLNGHHFSGDIQTIRFLSSDYLLVVTDASEHVLLAIDQFLGSEQSIHTFSGNSPLTWLWIDSMKIYIYVIENSASGFYAINVYNVTSGKELDWIKDTVNRPQLLLFNEAPTIAPPPKTASDDNVDAGMISGVVVGVVVVILCLIAAVAMPVIVVKIAKRNMYRQLHQRSTTPSLTSAAQELIKYPTEATTDDSSQVPTYNVGLPPHPVRPAGSVNPVGPPAGSVNPVGPPAGSVNPVGPPAGSVNPVGPPAGSVNPVSSPAGSTSPPANPSPTGHTNPPAATTNLAPAPGNHNPDPSNSQLLPDQRNTTENVIAQQATPDQRNPDPALPNFNQPASATSDGDSTPFPSAHSDQHEHSSHPTVVVRF